MEGIKVILGILCTVAVVSGDTCFGIDGAGVIPDPMGPINETIPLNISFDSFVSLQGELTEISNISGLSSLKINLAVRPGNETTEHQLTLNITIVDVAIEFKYNASGSINIPIGNLPSGDFSGSGNASVKISGLVVRGKGTPVFDEFGMLLDIATFTTITTFQKLNVDLGDILVGGKTVDWVLLSTTLTSLWPMIYPLVEPQLSGVVKGLIVGFMGGGTKAFNGQQKLFQTLAEDICLEDTYNGPGEVDTEAPVTETTPTTAATTQAVTESSATTQTTEANTEDPRETSTSFGVKAVVENHFIVILLLLLFAANNLLLINYWSKHAFKNK